MALRFSATRQSDVTVPHASGFASDTFAIGCCVRFLSAPTSSITNFMRRGSGFNLNYQLGYNKAFDELHFIIGDGSAAQAIMEYSWTPTVGRWYAIAATQNTAGNTTFLYLAELETKQGLSGETVYTQVNSGTAATTWTGTADVIFGSNTDVDIEITEAFIYNTNATKGTLDTNLLLRRDGLEAGLQGYWRFDEGLGGKGGTTLYDRNDGTGNDGTLNNRPLWVADPTDLLYDVGPLSTQGVLGYHNAVMMPGATVTSNDEDSSYPASEIRAQKIARVSRTNDVAANRNWVIDLGVAAPVDLITVHNHNISSAATTIDIRAHTADSWGSPAVTEDITYHPDTLVHFLASRYQYRYWRFAVADTTNADGYLEVGAIGLWTVFKGHIEPIGEVVPMVDHSFAVETAHGQRTTRSVTKSRRLRFSWATLRRGQSEELRRIMRDAAGLPYVFVNPEPHRRLYERAVYGPLVATPSFELGDPSWLWGDQGRALEVEEDYV